METVYIVYHFQIISRVKDGTVERSVRKYEVSVGEVDVSGEKKLAWRAIEKMVFRDDLVLFKLKLHVISYRRVRLGLGLGWGK